jgi:hypothetical protein
MSVSDVFVCEILIADIARIYRHDVASSENWGVVDARRLAPEFSDFLIWTGSPRISGRISIEADFFSLRFGGTV